MNKKHLTLKDNGIRHLKIENIQSTLLWAYKLKHPNNTKSPSFIRIKTTHPLAVKIILFNGKTDGPIKNEKFVVNAVVKEKLNTDKLLKAILTKVETTKVNIKNVRLNIENIGPFLIEDVCSVYCANYKFIPSKSKIESFDFSELKKFTKKNNLFLVAIDCEMVQTEKGHELGRVSIVDANGVVLYDEFVKPKNKVIDYLTTYSGLSADNTSNGISFERMQTEIEDVIGVDTIILGHSLENDLMCLGYHHERLIDTAHIFTYRDGRKMKLKDVMIKVFKTVIQEDEHSSVEDAKACINLLKYKIKEMSLYLNAKELICDFNAIDCFDVKLKGKSIVQEKVEIVEKYFDSTLYKNTPFNLKIYRMNYCDLDLFLSSCKDEVDNSFFTCFYADEEGRNYVAF